MLNAPLRLNPPSRSNGGKHADSWQCCVRNSLDLGGYGRFSKAEQALLAQLLEMPGTLNGGLEGLQTRVSALAA